MRQALGLARSGNGPPCARHLFSAGVVVLAASAEKKTGALAPVLPWFRADLSDCLGYLWLLSAD
jgi:hypothetical protein